MHHKNIKLIVRKQLKNQFPNWKRLPRKDKKELARKVLAEVASEHDFKQEINTPVDQFLTIEGQHPVRGIINPPQMLPSQK
jgi:hypothetical protein